MMRYLSPEWIAAVGEKVAASESLAELARVHEIGVTQVVTECPNDLGPDGTSEVTYHFQVGPDGASFGSGPAPSESVRLEQTWETSVAVATGAVPAQEVFIKGLVKITGDINRLIASQVVFGALDTAFESVRSNTDYA